MVRINLINPKNLTDQHLIAEYSETLILVDYIERYPIPIKIPKDFCLGKGHMIFFKNKLLYLKNRHDKIRKEMIKRNFRPIKIINLTKFKNELKNNWTPSKKDKIIIKKRISQRISKKPKWYRYYGKHFNKAFYLNLTENG